MKIAQFKTSTGRGGAETMLLDLVGALQERGCVIDTSFGEHGWLVEQFVQRGYAARVIGQRGSWLRGLVQAVRFLVESRADAVISHGAWANLQGATAARLVGIPSLAVEHGVDPWRYESSLRCAIDRGLGRLNCTRIAVSDSVAAMLVERRVMRRNRILTIANGVVSGPPAHISERQRARAICGCNEHAFLVGSVGRLVPIKGHMVLLSAFRALAADNDACRLVLVGDGPMRVALEAEVADADLSDRVWFAGERDDVRELLPAFDVFALPSQSEGLSMALLEAMAAGLPIVATAVGGNPELILDGQTGWLVPANDPIAIADVLRQVLARPLAAKEVGEAARVACLRDHSFERTASLYFEALRAATERRYHG